MPRQHNGHYLFPSDTTDLVKADFLFEAGSAYQPQMLCATAANKLLSVATTELNATQLAEFMDYRGVIIENNSDIYQSTLTVYMLHRFADEVIPVVRQMLTRPAFSPEDFLPWREKKKQQLATFEQQTSHLARRIFYQTLFGEQHPLGRYAVADDADRLELDTVRRYFHERYSPDRCTVVLAGNTNGLSQLLPPDFSAASIPSASPILTPEPSLHTHHITVANATQTSIRIGRILPIRWDEPDYADFMLLTTLFGGYFGSRLMTNLREDKGYTYGIYARTQIYRGCIVFYITADVAAGTAQKAQQEITREMRRLAEETVSDEELALVKTVLAADCIRSIDGIFERSARFCDMYATGVTEQLTANLSYTLQNTSASQLQQLAQRLLNPGDMLFCSAGA